MVFVEERNNEQVYLNFQILQNIQALIMTKSLLSSIAGRNTISDSYLVPRLSVMLIF